ncbi:MAG TPA: AAA family ATPase [Sulfurospirillum sp. UBA12182]|nr:MAG TPA: AAA family ATPase [Sulfurospirillum sp. UBA12182]
MQILDFLYEEENKNSKFFDRKISITSKKTLIKGVKKSGKTYIIYDYLSNFHPDEYLYIDLLDERIKDLHVEKNLEKFLENKKIKILVIENYDFTFPLPSLEEIIITSHRKDVKLEGFDELMLYPLDFEEFIAFDRKHFNIEQIFNIFANLGTFPQIVLEHEHNVRSNLQDLIRIIIQDETKLNIFKKICELQSTKISLFQIYNQLKSISKISKDKLYRSIKELENENILFFVEKFDATNANKKVYLCDFAIKNALSLKKDFLKRFENIVFSELYKRYKEIFYTDVIDFYLPKQNIGIICAPFSPKEFIEEKLKKYSTHLLDLSLQEIYIISVGNEDAFNIEGITCNIVPFWEWALQG